MGKFLVKFNSESDYQSATLAYVPNVSYCSQEHTVYYNKTLRD